jgi:hypothetical protein
MRLTIYSRSRGGHLLATLDQLKVTVVHSLGVIRVAKLGDSGHDEAIR